MMMMMMRLDPHTALPLVAVVAGAYPLLVTEAAVAYCPAVLVLAVVEPPSGLRTSAVLYASLCLWFIYQKHHLALCLLLV